MPEMPSNRSQGPQRQELDRFIARAILNPSTPICVVEGVTDRRLLEAVFLRRKVNAEVYSIDEIDVQNTDEDINFGNKGRVIYLSRVAEQKSARNCICVIDKDTDFLIGVDFSNSLCSYHTFLQIDWYPLSRSALKKSMSSFCKSDLSEIEFSAILDDALYGTRIRALRDSVDRSVALPIWKNFITNSGRLDRKKIELEVSKRLGIELQTLEEGVRAIEKRQGADHRKSLHFGEFKQISYAVLKFNRRLSSSASMSTISAGYSALLFNCVLENFSFWGGVVRRCEETP